MTEISNEYKTTDKLNKKEHGAIIVEATLSLSFFMFAIYTVLSVIQICYAQERMAIALNAAAKQLSQYSHVTRATGINEMISENDGPTSSIANKISDFLVGIGEGVSDYNIVPEEYTDFMIGAGESLKNDSIMDILRTNGGDAIILGLMQTNLKTDGYPDMDTFLKRNHIVGYDFLGSNYIENSKNIYVKINYDVEVVKLLNIEKVFHLSHAAYLESW